MPFLHNFASRHKLDLTVSTVLGSERLLRYLALYRDAGQEGDMPQRLPDQESWVTRSNRTIQNAVGLNGN